MKKARHLLFKSNDQLSFLAKAKTWYMDGTLKIVIKPFKQLFTIHTIFKNDNCNVKQVLLMYVLMTRRKTKDYVQVLRAVVELFSISSDPAVEKVRIILS